MRTTKLHIREWIALSLLLSSIPALAAQPPNGADWSGLYAGVRLAEGWGEAHLGTGHYDPAFPFAPTSIHLRGAGAGVSLGYDWQRGNLIYGLGVDVLGTHIEGTKACTPTRFPGWWTVATAPARTARCMSGSGWKTWRPCG